jgi:hypothetical protein
MLKVDLKVSSTVTISAEADKPTELFEQISLLQEVFSHDKCGKCGEKNLRYIVRTDSDKNKYYELQCQSCYAKLTFGQNKDNLGRLYPRRKETDKKSIMQGKLEKDAKLPDNGWVRYNLQKKEME